MKINLFAGTQTNSTAQGTASLYLVLHDSGAATTISSIFVFNPSDSQRPMIFQCSSANSCSAVSSPVVNGNSDTNFTTSSTEFFIGAKVSLGTTYGYLISFVNGTPVLGSIIATLRP